MIVEFNNKYCPEAKSSPDKTGSSNTYYNATDNILHMKCPLLKKKFKLKSDLKQSHTVSLSMLYSTLKTVAGKKLYDILPCCIGNKIHHMLKLHKILN